jgi:hypothetical protein
MATFILNININYHQGIFLIIDVLSYINNQITINKVNKFVYK